MVMGLERFGLRTIHLVWLRIMNLLVGAGKQIQKMTRLEAVEVVRQTMIQSVVEADFQTMKILQLVECFQTAHLLFVAAQTSCLAVVEMLRTMILFAVVVGLLQKENLLFGLVGQIVILVVGMVGQITSLAGLVGKHRRKMILVEQVGS